MVGRRFRNLFAESGYKQNVARRPRLAAVGHDHHDRHVHLIPTDTPGVYKLGSHLIITGGATEQLQLHGIVNFGTLSAEGSFVGTVCGVG